MSTTKQWSDDVPSKMIDESLPEIQQWMAEGRALVQVASAHQWAIADWMLRGEKSLGQRAAYDFAEKATGYSRKTLTEWAYVARNVSIRMDSLSFGHHQAVAPLVPLAQKQLLAQAAEEGMPITTLREMARWQPRPLEVDVEKRFASASILLRIGQRDLDTLEIGARELGFQSFETNSAVGQLIYQLILEYCDAHRDWLKAADADYVALATDSGFDVHASTFAKAPRAKLSRKANPQEDNPWTE